MVITIDKFKKEEKRRERKQKFDDACMDFAIWWQNNKEWAIVVIPAAFAVTAKVASVTAKTIKALNANKQAQVYYDQRVYDPRTGIKYTTIKPMSAGTKRELGRLINGGMSTYDALIKMDLI